MSGSKTAIWAALFGNLLIAISKFAAATYTGSSAMVSEGFHSMVDTGNQVLLLYGLKKANKPPDERFPFGHGKEVYFWCFVVAILIFAVGAGLSIYEGVQHILDPHPVKNPGINYLVLGLGIIFEGVAWGLAFRAFLRVKGPRGIIETVQKTKDPSLFVVLFEDSAALLGLVVAGVGIYLASVTGNPFYDGLASIVIGCILALTAVWLAYESKGLLIGESANLGVVRGIRNLAATTQGVTHVNEVLTMHMGPEYVLVNLSLDFDDNTSTTDIEALVSRLDREIKAAFPLVKRVYVEAESRTRHTAPPIEPPEIPVG